MITLRFVTPEDLRILRHWEKNPHLLEAGVIHEDWGWEVELHRSPEWRELLIAEREGRPIGFIQIIDPAREESHYWGEVADHLRAIDIWIGEASDLGQGYGTQMMRLALERCFADPAVRAVLVDPLASNTRAHQFYERLGFQGLDQNQFGADHCFVYQLIRDDWCSQNYTQNSAHEPAC